MKPNEAVFKQGQAVGKELAELIKTIKAELDAGRLPPCQVFNSGGLLLLAVNDIAIISAKKMKIPQTKVVDQFSKMAQRVIIKIDRQDEQQVKEASQAVARLLCNGG